MRKWDRSGERAGDPGHVWQVGTVCEVLGFSLSGRLGWVENASRIRLGSPSLEDPDELNFVGAQST